MAGQPGNYLFNILSECGCALKCIDCAFNLPYIFEPKNYTKIQLLLYNCELIENYGSLNNMSIIVTGKISKFTLH